MGDRASVDQTGKHTFVKITEEIKNDIINGAILLPVKVMLRGEKGEKGEIGSIISFSKGTAKVRWDSDGVITSYFSSDRLLVNLFDISKRKFIPIKEIIDILDKI